MVQGTNHTTSHSYTSIGSVLMLTDQLAYHVPLQSQLLVCCTVHCILYATTMSINSVTSLKNSLVVFTLQPFTHTLIVHPFMSHSGMTRTLMHFMLTCPLDVLVFSIFWLV